MCQADREGNIGEFFTSQKSPVPDMCQAIGQGDGGEIFAFIKSQVTDMSQTVGQNNMFLVRKESNQFVVLFTY